MSLTFPKCWHFDENQLSLTGDTDDYCACRFEWMAERIERIAELEAERDQLKAERTKALGSVIRLTAQNEALTAERDRYKAAYEDFLCRMHEVAQCAKGSCALCPNCVTKLLGVKP